MQEDVEQARSTTYDIPKEQCLRQRCGSYSEAINTTPKFQSVPRLSGIPPLGPRISAPDFSANPLHEQKKHKQRVII
jgi:hypothetical protein